MIGDEQKFEEFLRGFEPQRPRPLPLVTDGWSEIRRLAAAAAVLMAIGASLWLGLQGSKTKYAELRPAATQEQGGAMTDLLMMSSTALTRAALENQKQFDAQMNDIAPRTLPRFDRADSSMRILAKE